MWTKLAIVLCSAAIPLSALASQSWAPISDVTRCRGNLALVGKCFSLHGAMSIGNGTPGVRIWPVGTKRILGVLPSEDEIMPTEIHKHLTLGITIYADFEVCPFSTQKPGWMQMVCVQSASHVVVESPPLDNKGPMFLKLQGTYTVAPNNSFQRTRIRYAGSRR